MHIYICVYICKCIHIYTHIYMHILVYPHPRCTRARALSPSTHTHTSGACTLACPAPHTNTEWRRCIGRLKLQVSFCKRAINYGSLLRKMTCVGKASYGFSPPCTCHPAFLFNTHKNFDTIHAYHTEEVLASRTEDPNQTPAPHACTLIISLCSSLERSVHNMSTCTRMCTLEI